MRLGDHALGLLPRLFTQLLGGALRGDERRAEQSFELLVADEIDLELLDLVQHLVGGLEEQLDLPAEGVGFVARQRVGGDLEPFGAVLDLFDDLVTAGDLAVMLAALVVLLGFGGAGKRKLHPAIVTPRGQIFKPYRNIHGDVPASSKLRRIRAALRSRRRTLKTMGTERRSSGGVTLRRPEAKEQV